MKKSWIIIGFVVLVGVGAGLVWLLLNKTTSPTAPTQTTSDSSSSATVLPTDETSATQVTVLMKDTSFQPQSIKIKKGTKVTWTNKDSIRHNVVADSASNVAGLPTTNSLIGKDETYSFTFNNVGTITYHCAAHPVAMTATIEVVE
jgi:plastocyanin